ncbi:MAG: saccharopine dehydrogenase family protein [Candidatus Bathyarchaeota archaeon]|nr:saccharopine dehydrogenase family protein [Candidatus Bathyarchaeota archaeon]
MKVIVLGSGKIGAIMGKEFANCFEGTNITMADINEERAQKAASDIPEADWTTIDTTNASSLVDKLKGNDLVLGALPGDYGYISLKAAVEAKVNILDVSFSPEDPMSLDGKAKRNKVTVIPDCGVAPGLSNILVGYATSRLDKVKKIKIMVGGIPETPVPPLEYTITWSADGLIDEYVRDVSIIQGGEMVEVPALSGLEEIDFPGVGTLEAFYTDGLRTLSKSIPGVENMWEKTLRYPGHVKKIKLLKDLGFFSDESVTVGGSSVSPRLFSARLLERSLWMPEVGDLLAMQIEVQGESSGKETTLKYRVVDRFDHETGVSAMARTTGYTAAIVASMLARDRITEKGVIPPEKLGMNPEFTRRLIAELNARGINVEEIEA